MAETGTGSQEPEGDGTETGGRAPSRRTRILRRSLWALLGLVLFYLAGINLVLVPEIGVPIVNRKPERFRMHWDRAWTLLPGVIHMKGLDMEARAGKGSWHAEADRVRGRIDLPDLLHRRFRIASLEGAGLTFIAQLPPGVTPGPEPYQPDQLTAETEEATGRETLVPPSPPAEPVERKTGPGGWEIVLEGVDIEEVREVTIGPYAYSGQGSVTGGMSFKFRGGPLEVPGARLILGAGELAIAGEPTGGVNLLDVEMQMDPARREDRSGQKTLRFMSGRVEVSAPEARLSALDFLFRRIPSMTLDGKGSLGVVALVDHGILQPGSTLSVQGTSAVGYLDYTLYGDMEIIGEVGRGEGGEVRGTMDLLYETFELRLAEAEEPHVMGQGATVKIATSELQLAELDPDVQAVVDIPDSQVPRLAYYNRFLPPGSGARILGGKGTFSALLRLQAPEGTWSGDVSLVGSGVRVDLQGNRLEGEVHLEALLPDGNIQERRAGLADARLRIDRARFYPRRGERAGTPWWARLEIPEGEMTLGKPLKMEGKFKAKVKNTRPLLALVRGDKKSPRWLRNLLAVEDVSGTGEITFLPDYVEARNLDLEGGDNLEVRGHLRLVDEDLAALLFCRYRKLSASVEISGGERDWDLVGSRKWFERREKGWLRKLRPPPASVR